MQVILASGGCRGPVGSSHQLTGRRMNCLPMPWPARPSSPDTVGRATLITSRKPGAAAIPTAETLAVSQLDSSLQRSRT